MQAIFDRLARLKEDNLEKIKNCKSAIASYEEYIQKEQESIKFYEDDILMAEEAIEILKKIVPQ